ncbi:hypothetical protein C8J45_101336 [Sphingomonas sp. PP-CE-3G-477]|uniref:MAE_28990/MAE_18760 family HEPN-like nuclease n=1 Tax=Sphingomonas sp. PP-CE-3G-477 TaxID=2135660 RepID=UPI000D44F3F1|nr:MAE_28990/MAE_18760 family HEPN-like nuclease [Sphingomonas sp. PP-CE-3G-477]PTQ65489.1 hypothetical protein C8J45_101336 [Sphingomonas sp. PP-CE-3G-477]
MASLQLKSTIDQELKWREAELAVAKLYLYRSVIDKSAFAYSYRCFVVLTYAHYEAFTKRVIAQSMLDIFDSGAKWSECRFNIRKHLFASGLRKIVDNKSNGDLATFGSVSATIIDNVTPPPVSIIMDCGNLNYPTFIWAIESVGIDSSKYGFARPDIGKLVSMRHDCAHGESLTFDPTKTDSDLAKDMFALQQRIVFLLHHLSVELLDHFSLGSLRGP